jgi:hypothetical protein
MPESAGDDRRGMEAGPVTAVVPGGAGLHSEEVHPEQARLVLDELVDSLSDVGVLLRAAADLPSDADRVHISEALSDLNLPHGDQAVAGLC